MYFVLWDRLATPSWQQGHLLYAALVDRSFARFEFDWTPYTGVLAVLCLAALFLEVCAPVLLWVKGIGRYWALLLIGFHLGIEISATVGWWNWMMITALLTFLPREWFEWVRRRRPGPEGACDTLPAPEPASPPP